MKIFSEKYKKGDRVLCTGGGLQIECEVVDETWHDVKILDPITGRMMWVSHNQICHDKQYYRDKTLKELGI